MDLADANVLITEGSGAIGTAIAIEFAKAGADITVGYHTDEAGAQAAVDAARTHSVDAQAVAADVTDNETVETIEKDK